jgi:hypothetical protein
MSGWQRHCPLMIPGIKWNQFRNQSWNQQESSFRTIDSGIDSRIKPKNQVFEKGLWFLFEQNLSKEH